MLTKWCALLSVLFATAFAKEHQIQIWDDIQFEGASVVITLQSALGVEYCDTMGQDWQNRVSSLNTRLNCYEIYDGTQCNGNVRYMYPGSPSHNKLTDLNFNDKMKSFRLCDLDESAVETTDQALSRRSLSPNRPEKGFWEYFFRKYSSTYLNNFLARAQSSWFISWDFIPNVSGSKGQQYQYALEWSGDVINGHTFGLDDLREMRRRAQEVVDDRADRNRQHAGSSANSRSDAIHHQLEFIWQQLVATLDNEIVYAQNEDDYDEHGLR